MLKFYPKLGFACSLLIGFALVSCHDPTKACFPQLKFLPYGNWKTQLWAGSGEAGWLDGDASIAKFNQPSSLVLDSSGNLYLADTGNNKIRKLDPTGKVSTLVDASTTGSTGCPPSGLVSPTALALDAPNNQLYFTNGEEVMLLHFQPCSLVSVAKLNSANPTNDALGLAIGKKGELYFTKSSRNQVFIVRGKDATVFSGTGEAGINSPISDAVFKVPPEIPSKQALFNFPAGLAIDNQGQLLVADLYNHALRTIDTTSGIVRILRYRSDLDYKTSSSEFIWHTQPLFSYPSGIALDASGDLFVSNLETIRTTQSKAYGTTGNYGKIRRIERGDERIGRPGTESWLGGEELADFPWQKNKVYAYSLAVDASGANVYLANANENKIYKLSLVDLSKPWVGTPYCLSDQYKTH